MWLGRGWSGTREIGASDEVSTGKEGGSTLPNAVQQDDPAQL